MDVHYHVVVGRLKGKKMTNILVAVLIVTNLVSHPCTGGTPGGKCKFCRDWEGMRVPEHIHQIGYDLDWVVTTQYLPVVEMPIGK